MALVDTLRSVEKARYSIRAKNEVPWKHRFIARDFCGVLEVGTRTKRNKKGRSISEFYISTPTTEQFVQILITRMLEVCGVRKTVSSIFQAFHEGEWKEYQIIEKRNRIGGRAIQKQIYLREAELNDVRKELKKMTAKMRVSNDLSYGDDAAILEHQLSQLEIITNERLESKNDDQLEEGVHKWLQHWLSGKPPL